MIIYYCNKYSSVVVVLQCSDVCLSVDFGYIEYK